MPLRAVLRALALAARACLCQHGLRGRAMTTSGARQQRARYALGRHLTVSRVKWPYLVTLVGLMPLYFLNNLIITNSNNNSYVGKGEVGTRRGRAGAPPTPSSNITTMFTTMVYNPKNLNSLDNIIIIITTIII